MKTKEKKFQMTSFEVDILKELLLFLRYVTDTITVNQYCEQTKILVPRFTPILLAGSFLRTLHISFALNNERIIALIDFIIFGIIRHRDYDATAFKDYVVTCATQQKLISLPATSFYNILKVTVEKILAGHSRESFEKEKIKELLQLMYSCKNIDEIQSIIIKLPKKDTQNSKG